MKPCRAQVKNEGKVYRNMVHIRFEGRSLDLNERDLELTTGMTDADIKARIARRLEVRPEKLRSYVVDRPASGNIVIRPEAVYG